VIYFIQDMFFHKFSCVDLILLVWLYSDVLVHDGMHERTLTVCFSKAYTALQSLYV